jgi:hypothetical protein
MTPHAFCSLPTGEGMAVVEVGHQAGRASTMALATDADVIAGGELMSVSAAWPLSESENPRCPRDGRWWTRTTDLFLIRDPWA